MIGFHINMNVAQFRRAYLENWLGELARLGYDTIIWELENNITWRTCPECVSPDAFSKDEFGEILALSDKLGFNSIPLFQTIGHCEYVLKHDKYKPFAEVQSRIDQYCPQNPDVIDFLGRWIDEYLELFGPVKHFHLGADEAYTLGRCDKCAAYANDNSLSQLFIDHINVLSKPLISQGITPIIWGDMLLKHPEAMDKLSRKVMIFDWMYDIYRGNGKVFVWGRGLCSRDEIPPETVERFGSALFPHGDETGRDPETFYTADYLSEHGFDVVTCPGSACFGDNVFAPRQRYHLANTFDSFHKGATSNLSGSVLTSWTVRLFPWELQTACIDAPAFINKHPQATLDEFVTFYLENRFGTTDAGLFEACGMLAKSCIFMDVHSLGFNHHTLPVPINYVHKHLAGLSDSDLQTELDNCRTRLDEYLQAQRILTAFAEKAAKGHDLLANWNLAARNLVNRTAAAAVLLRKEITRRTRNTLAESVRQEARDILNELQQLKKETENMYRTSLKPSRRAEVISWLFDSVEHALTFEYEENIYDN